ncbi:MAG: hypothetical protein F6J90_08855 [Moorea sp. SIOASIH]|uniref:hypothetical protein n=1 Tax=Moorena sp. SIOASIH TaxID=2607817 RepID=UPI0013BB41BA|nr:hypothetical protein [Moorena sp. SIOASIH]NEO36424.1 hypothetical protein [Moorena sp. SIOASIH]
MLAKITRVNCQEFNDLFVEEISLEDVSIEEDTIKFVYSIEDEPIPCSIRYDTVDFTAPIFKYPERTLSFAVVIAAICSIRFGALLPKRLNFKRYSRYIDKELLEFLKFVMYKHWSQHRYQVGQISYHGPEFAVTDSELGKDAHYPLWSAAKSDRKAEVLLASGSGKDSLLCSRILEAAGVKYDIATGFHDIYGDHESQEKWFDQVMSYLKAGARHGVYFQDEYYLWLENRLNKTNIPNRTRDYFGRGRFRPEAGEALMFNIAMIPIQILHGIPILAGGDEKSADAPNLKEPESGELVTHEWLKSFTFHQTIFKLRGRMFEGINSTSLLKPIHDIRIFQLLFELDSKLPYATNSCNLQKPWCCRCEKCCYVFAGFCAYGDVDKTIQAFKNNLFDMEENLPYWEELLGLKGYIPFECIGLPEEAQWYFYKLYLKGIKGLAMELFVEKVLNPLKAKGEHHVEEYFSEIEQRFSQVYENHHTMPEWLWQKIRPVLTCK